MEKARAAGIKCEMCIVGDDCALPKDKGITGRRGIAGTLFVHKIAGAAAAAGMSLEEVTAQARAAADNVASMGVALSTCTLPGNAPNTRLDGDLVEIGLGIHGEPGAEQCKWRPSDELVEEALKSILDPIKGGDNKPYVEANKGAEVAVLINSLGATPPMEVAVLGRKIVAALTARGIVVARCLSGALMTSMDMAGFSVSLLLLTPQRVGLLDSGTSAPSWPAVYDLTKPAPATVKDPLEGQSTAACSGTGLEPSLAKKVKAAAEALVAAEQQLTEWDQVSRKKMLESAPKLQLKKFESAPKPTPLQAGVGDKVAWISRRHLNWHQAPLSFTQRVAPQRGAPAPQGTPSAPPFGQNVDPGVNICRRRAGQSERRVAFRGPPSLCRLPLFVSPPPPPSLCAAST
jgi:hypothetical protein